MIQLDKFQKEVADWMGVVFNGQGGKDIPTRNFRFLEEALELVQSTGCTKEEAHQLVEYVFNRPVGEPAQEVAGTLVTLAALCNMLDISMAQASHNEVNRLWQPEVMEKIRNKQKSKPNRSPLPGKSEIDTGDVVRHNPSGEEWVVAYVIDGRLCACGWPFSEVNLSECTLVKKATADERVELLQQMASGTGDSRGTYATKTLRAEGLCG